MLNCNIQESLGNQSGYLWFSDNISCSNSICLYIYISTFYISFFCVPCLVSSLDVKILILFVPFLVVYGLVVIFLNQQSKTACDMGVGDRTRCMFHKFQIDPVYVCEMTI